MSSVLEKEDADKVVVAYMPRKFPLVISPMAREFVAHQKEHGDAKFRIDRLNAQHTGVAELERESIEQQVERLALEKVKQIQEEAYQEAYQLGLAEGRERAFNEDKAQLQERIEGLDKLMTSVGNLKTELISANEAHFMKLLFFMASRVAMDEIRSRPETILSVLRQATEGAQSEEKVTARVSKADFDFIQNSKEKLGKELEFVKRIKLEESDAIRPGGCIVETNFGSVDASIEKRVAKLWEAVTEKLPKVTDTVGES